MRRYFSILGGGVDLGLGADRDSTGTLSAISRPNLCAVGHPSNNDKQIFHIAGAGCAPCRLGGDLAGVP